MTRLTKRRKHHRVFNKKDFYSGDGFLTTVWGPAQWHMLHTISFNYPVNPTEEDKTNYKAFIEGLCNVLPCGACRKNLRTNLDKMPLLPEHLDGREAFSKYVYQLHELVNKMLKKKSNLTYCDVRERYEHFRARCTTDSKAINDAKSESTKVFSPQSVSNAIEKNSKGKSTRKEKGCTEPVYGKKARCILSIVPQEHAGPSIQINNQCYKTRKRHSKKK